MFASQTGVTLDEFVVREKDKRGRGAEKPKFWAAFSGPVNEVPEGIRCTNMTYRKKRA